MLGPVSHCNSCREYDRQVESIHVLPLRKTITNHNPRMVFSKKLDQTTENGLRSTSHL